MAAMARLSNSVTKTADHGGREFSLTHETGNMAVANSHSQCHKPIGMLCRRGARQALEDKRDGAHSAKNDRCNTVMNTMTLDIMVEGE